MKLTDLNRYGGVGASSHLVELGGLRILIDCGLHPKLAGRDATPALGLLEERPPDVLLVTHCHLDHLGAVPMVMRDYPNIPALMSVPSSMLAERLLRNSVNVMKRQREEGSLTEPPLFGMGEVEAAVARFAPMPFGHPRKMSVGSDEVEITFFPAGHVTGAAGIRLVHKHRAIFFSGDVQFEEQAIVGGAAFPTGHFDTVVTETTRGATERPAGQDRASEAARLVKTINHILDRGGSVLIPVFALGRMQEIFMILHEARTRHQLSKDVPIYSGGLGIDLCDYLDDVTKKTGLCTFRRSVLRDLGVKPLPRTLVAGREPTEQGIYVASSGMVVENTPSYLLASCLIGHHHHGICFVGYCDPDTQGGRILAARHGDTLVFDTVNYQTAVHASVDRFELTGHADREELLEFALQADPRAIVLNHGDPPARAWFADAILERAPKTRVLDPRPLETYEV